MHIADLNKEQTQKMAAEIWVGLLLGANGFIMQKLGLEGIKEFRETAAKNNAQGVKAQGINNPKSFADNFATMWRNVYGSDIEIGEESGVPVINHSRCACLRVALDFAKRGVPITKEQQCSGCISYYRSLLENLGMKLNSNLTEEGCVFKISGK